MLSAKQLDLLHLLVLQGVRDYLHIAGIIDDTLPMLMMHRNAYWRARVEVEIETRAR